MALTLAKKDVVSVHGVKIAVDETAISPNIMQALTSGSYESVEARQLDGIVQKGERVVELGGGLGFISSKIGLLGRAESITVYEANPDLIPLIERTHALNGVKAETLNAVVAPRASAPTMPFYVRRDFWASSLSPDPYGYERAIDVPVVDFDAMLRARRPTMLVVDIEGGEEMLFQDIALTGVRKVYLELHQNVIGRVGMKRVFDFFSARDFHYDQWHSTHAVVLFSHVLR